MRVFAAVVVTIALLGCSHAKPKPAQVPKMKAGVVKAALPPPVIICGADEMVRTVGPLLVAVAPAVIKATPDMAVLAVLAAVEKQVGLPAFVCTLLRAHALVSINGGPQYPELVDTLKLLRGHADAVRISTNLILAKRQFVLAPVTPPTKRK